MISEDELRSRLEALERRVEALEDKSADGAAPEYLEHVTGIDATDKP